MKITGITTRKRGRGANQRHVCTIEVDGEAWAELEAETVVKENLRTGQAVDEARLEAIRRADETLKAAWEGRKRTALRPRARRDVGRVLREKGFSRPARTQALDRLEAAGAVDDREVARRHVRRRLREGGWGRERIREEILAQGVGADIAEAVLSEGLADYDERAACRSIVEKRRERYEPLTDPRNRRRLEALLARRGFDGETIRAAMGEEEYAE